MSAHLPKSCHSVTVCTANYSSSFNITSILRESHLDAESDKPKSIRVAHTKNYILREHISYTDADIIRNNLLKASGLIPLT